MLLHLQPQVPQGREARVPVLLANSTSRGGCGRCRGCRCACRGHQQHVLWWELRAAVHSAGTWRMPGWLGGPRSAAEAAQVSVDACLLGDPEVTAHWTVFLYVYLIPLLPERLGSLLGRLYFSDPN